RLITSCLEEDGIHAETAANGREALGGLDRFSPDLIFLDLMMPEMDGIQFLENIRGDPRRCHLPVVIITAKNLTPEEIRRLQSDTRGIIGKAANLKEELKTMLYRVLQHEASPVECLQVNA